MKEEQMSITISEETTVELLDGTKLSLRPLKLSLLRPFLKEFAKIQEVAEDDDKSMDLLLDCVVIALEQFNPELAKDRAKLEDILDLPTVYKIVGEASGNAALLPSSN
jgi:inhibitor of KinA sporulation pathway (predicted exonuclease)